MLALGTDSGGSIRIPAACCGIVGFKPTYDSSPPGCFPLAPSYDHVGPMARTVEECVELLRALVAGLHAARAGLARRDPRGVAWPDEADPLVRERVREAAGHFPRSASRRLAVPDRREPRSSCARSRMSTASSSPENGELYGEEIAVKIERCLAVIGRRSRNGPSRRASSTANAAWSSSTGSTCWSLRRCSASRPATGIGDLALRERLIANTFPFNTLGWPALALPCGPRRGRAPGLGPAGRETGHGRAGSGGRQPAGIPHLRDSRTGEAADNHIERCCVPPYLPPSVSACSHSLPPRRRRSLSEVPRRRICTASCCAPTSRSTTPSPARRPSPGIPSPARFATSSSSRRARASARAGSSTRRAG